MRWPRLCWDIALRLLIFHRFGEFIILLCVLLLYFAHTCKDDEYSSWILMIWLLLTLKWSVWLQRFSVQRTIYESPKRFLVSTWMNMDHLLLCLHLDDLLIVRVLCLPNPESIQKWTQIAKQSVSMYVFEAPLLVTSQKINWCCTSIGYTCILFLFWN